MSYAAFKMMHWPTGIENCAAGFFTHSPSSSSSSSAAAAEATAAAEIPPLPGDELEAAEWQQGRRRRGVGAVPDLVVTAGNVLEIYVVRAQEDEGRAPRASGEQKRGGGGGGVVDGISGARLELVCHYRLHGNVESMAVLSVGADNRSNRRDSIVLAFQDAKITVLEYDDSLHGLRTSSMHCFEGPDWQYLKRGRESFARGPIVKADPSGRCGGALVYGLQMIILKAAQAGQSLVGDDEPNSAGGTISVRIESSYVINLRELDMNHVKDFTFVHGYIEPVMVILHEREPTWAGRISWKHHTCMISALSVSTTLKQHPMIWSASNLPHDAYKLLAVPSPIGGVLVICANSIHYHSQSASCSLSLNSFSSQPDGSLEMPKSNFAVELDAAHATWLSHDVAMFSSKTGELLLLTLVYDGRIVQRLDLVKSKASVLTSGLTTIGSSFFFLGSRLGDSLLVQYSCGTSVPTSSQVKDEATDIDGDVPSAKRLRRMSSDALQDVTSVEELSLYNNAPNSSESAQKSFSFAVRDSLINVGPLKDFSYGLRINADPNSTGLAKQSNYELVCCSGHGKNGALCVLQQSIRPELITEVVLAGCKGIWTVYHKSSRGHATDSSKTMTENDEYHAYLIISLESRTMVLETADDLGEVTETVDYYVHGSTIAAGNLFGRRRVIQIYAKGARILDGSYMTQELNFVAHNSEQTSSELPTVASVSIADPYVLLKMTDGSIQLLLGDPAACTVSLNAPAIFSSSTEPISACTLYHDKGPEPWLRKTSTDAWLSTGVAEPIDGNDGSYHDHGDIYCLVCYENGKLEIFDVPSFKSVYSVDNFVSGKTYLADTYTKDPNKYPDTKGYLNKEPVQNMRVVELAMQRWSGRYSRPFLFGMLSDGTILCYHAYFYEGTENAVKGGDPVSPRGSADTSSMSISRLRNLRFLRVSIDITTREEMLNAVSRPRITVFNNVGGYQGLFLSGSRPAWLMVCRERIRVHPQLCDGSIAAFAVLHNVNCNHGLIYVTSQGYLKICQLPSSFNYDNHWPVQKIPLLGTPHQVTYYAEKNLYPLILSVPVIRPLNQVLSSLLDQEMSQQIDNDNFNSDDLQKTYSVDEFEVRILEPDKSGHWDTKATVPMQTSENALTVRIVTLFNTTTKENESLMAIGTAYVQGEDVAARGRVLLFSFAKTNESSQNLISEVYSKELKGAVSNLASLQGHLLIASGPKITLHKWTGSELNGVAFYDAPLHVVSLNIVKNFILFGDVHKSIYFLNWKEQGAQLSLLAKDFGPLNCYATEFLIDGSTLSLVVSDDQKNIQIFYYAPKMLESWKGQKLLSRAEFHAGALVSKFLRLQMLPTSSDRSGATVPGSEKTNRFALLFSTLDGSIGCIAPLEELTFRRLQTLQRKLVDAVPHVCGLNPRSFRQFHSNGKAHRPGPDHMVDFELLSHYEMLPLEEQLEIAHQIGTTRSQILSNFNDLSLGTSFL
ncbi:probable cleavage and polyadenylation specificity factor subunit 1 isoform X1 [Ananas comosus]|uniref:Cleavage and polyadenylation specificity factor 160 kDa subunit n=2 Tax=Ananas comosus TaxID=4615 RepID=A0A6P5ELK2_ANACO|nr:probable cleavage and polyadenylation specificity factor subunit 1 isoform X1 [Ananas comosus]